MRIESGPTVERKVRTSLAFALFAIFSLWFAYDGWQKYARDNVEEYLDQIPSEKRDAARTGHVYPSVAASTEPEARATLDRIGTSERRKAIEDLYGGPPSYESADQWLYYGPAFLIRVTATNGRPTAIQGIRPKHSETDIAFQKGTAIALAILAVLFGLHAIRARRVHVVVDDGGLHLNHRPPIHWDAMRELDADRFRAKGWVDLYYGNDGQKQVMVRLDEYHFAKFDDIMTEICARKGFANPIKRETVAEAEPSDAGTTDRADSGGSPS